jgi:hypothetical protein
MKENQVLVLWFAAFVAVLVLASAYFTDHNGDIDTLGLYNPSYMLAHTGKLTYPVHGYYDEPVIVHPPIHVGAIGLFLRAGLTWHYAEATPTAFFFLLAILLATVLPAGAMIRIALIFPIAFLSLGSQFTTHMASPWGVMFATRPEGHVFGAWFCGLLLLENGRLRQWDYRWLVAGAFLSAWAAGVHYYAWASLFGVLIYVLLAFLSLGRMAALRRAAALIGGACLFGIPYLTLYVIPNWSAITQVVGESGGFAGVGVSVKAHRDWYSAFANTRFDWLLRGPFLLKVPLLVWSTAVLLIVRATRALALSAAPLLLAILLVTPHKQFAYLIHEFAFFLAALFIGLFFAVDWLLDRIHRQRMRQFLLPATTAILTLYLFGTTDVLKAAVHTGEPVVEEGDVARAAARSILGPNAKVASRIGLWYASGAAWWHDTTWDLLDYPDSYHDPIRYLSNFDAAADYTHASDRTAAGGTTLSALYASGQLALRGFYFGETNPDLRFVLLKSERAAPIVGYAARRGQLLRFTEQPDGEEELTLRRCPPLAQDADTQLRFLHISYARFALPVQAGQRVETLFHLLTPRGAANLPLLNGCTILSTTRGATTPVDKTALIDKLRREDQPIHFSASLDELPGYRAIGVPPKLAAPSDVIRLDHVLKRAEAKIVTTPHGSGSFAISIPAEQGRGIAAPCWVQFRLRVLTGRIGLMVWNGKNNQESYSGGAFLSKTDEPVDIAVKLPQMKDTYYATLYNGSMSLPSKFEILDAAVMVSRETWQQQQNTLAALR